MSETRRIGTIRISEEFLADRLGFPPGTRVRFARTDFYGIQLGLEGETLPECKEENMAPELMVIFRQEVRDGQRYTYSAWQHDQDNWRLCDVRPILPIQDDLKVRGQAE